MTGGSPPQDAVKLSIAAPTVKTMPEHCDKCGTELHEEQHRHQRYRIEPVSESDEMVAGRLCSDCVLDFRKWLENR